MASAKEGIGVLNNKTLPPGKTMSFTGKWGNFKLAVEIRRIEGSDHFYLTIVSPLFNINKELCRKDVLSEVKKVMDFLEAE